MNSRQVIVSLMLTACVPSTGGKLVNFTLSASGPTDVTPAGPFRFATPQGFEVTLDEANLWVGAVYFNQVNPAGYSQETACILPGLYTGEVREGLRINALSPQPQPFPVTGTGSDLPTLSAELWLSGGDINADDDRTVVATVRGVATRSGDRWPFAASVRIGNNRRAPPRNPALPGSNPLCKQRIVSPIAAEFALAESAQIKLTIDPRQWFSSVDFSTLTAAQQVGGIYQFSDSSAEAGQAETAFYNALRATANVYKFDIVTP
jgi:hypothetical protein